MPEDDAGRIQPDLATEYRGGQVAYPVRGESRHAGGIAGAMDRPAVSGDGVAAPRQPRPGRLAFRRQAADLARVQLTAPLRSPPRVSLAMLLRPLPGIKQVGAPIRL